MIINLTSQTVTAIAEDGHTVEWPPRPRPADLHTRQNGAYANYRVHGQDSPTIPICGVLVHNDRATGIPDETPGIYYIVPLGLALTERFRLDLLVPWVQDGVPGLATVSTQ